MLNIGLIGADSFHAPAFAKLANFSADKGGSGLDVRVNAIWGEGAERAKLVAEQADIPVIVDKIEDLLYLADAVMIVTRDGGSHLTQAAPFIKKSVPVWIDKPFTYTLSEAHEIISLAEQNNSFLAGGSFCKYCPDVLHIKSELERIGGTEKLYGAHFNFPAQAADPHGGFHFYAPHTAEILSTVFGNDIKSIKADDNNGNVIAIFKYDSFSVSVNFAQVSDFSCVLYGKSEVVASKIDISDIYRYGFDKVVRGIISKTPPESYQSLIWPVKTVNALIEAINSNCEVYIK